MGRNSGRERAADKDRVGVPQPPPPGSIGGPWQLRTRSSTSRTHLKAPPPRHQAAGAAAPRHHAWSSNANPQAGVGLGIESTARTHSFRAVKARGRGAPQSFFANQSTGPSTAGDIAPLGGRRTLAAVSIKDLRRQVTIAAIVSTLLYMRASIANSIFSLLSPSILRVIA